MKYPVIFVSGILAPTHGHAWSYFNGVRELAAASGIEAHFIPLPAWGTLEERAILIERFLSEKLLAGQAHFVCHSKGGIDLRFLLNRENAWHRVASFTSLGVPYQGAYSATWALNLLLRLKKLGVPAPRGIEVLRELDAAYLRALWEKDRLEVASKPRFYVAARQTRAWRRLLYPLFAYLGPKIQEVEGDNDGFVSVESASWGTPIAIVDTHHIGLIGHLYGLTCGFDHLNLYARVFERIREVESHGK